MKLYLKALLDRYIYLLPIFMLIFELLSNFIDFNFVVMGNLIGCSLFTNIVFLYLFNFTKNKYCWLTRNSPIGLIITNFINITGYYIEYGIYQQIFNIAICSIIFSLSFIHFLRKNM